MLHYHGTPLTPKSELETLAGKNFCVSHAHQRDTEWLIRNAQSIMWDNGAFSAYTKGKAFNPSGYYDWLEDKLFGANWAVIPDVIGGCAEEQWKYLQQWPYPRHLSCAVWHMDLPIDWLLELSDEYPRIAFGSSGKYWKVNSDDWQRRADEAWEALERTGNRNWVHMMRGLKLGNKRWPFASADSCNVALSHSRHKLSALEMINRIDAAQTPLQLEKEYA